MSSEQELKSVLTSTQKDGANRISKDTVFSLGKSIRCGVRLVYTLLFGEEGNHTSATCSVAFSVTQTRGFRGLFLPLRFLCARYFYPVKTVSFN